MGQQSSKLLTLPLQKLFYRAVITAGTFLMCTAANYKHTVPTSTIIT